MSLTHFFSEPFYSLADFDKLFDKAFSARAGSAAPTSSALIRPRMDLHEDAETNTVTATFELPGLQKDAVHLTVQDGALTVSGEAASADTRDEKKGYVVRERRVGRFARTLPLPPGIKNEDVKATLENGVLTVTFPKTTPEQQPQRITIS